MSKKAQEKVEKLSGNQLVETVKDTIYEVLEEELDARIEAAKKNKATKSNKEKAARVKKLREAKRKAAERKAALKKIEINKKRLKEAYKRLQKKEQGLKKA